MLPSGGLNELKLGAPNNVLGAPLDVINVDDQGTKTLPGVKQRPSDQ